MLFVLTGDIQTGKTRWLLSAVDALERAGVFCAGVLAPGIWLDARAGECPAEWVDANGYAKLGIENELLPGHERIPFALRRELAELQGSADAGSQSSRAGLGWAIDDQAIARVNAHLFSLADDLAHRSPALLVIDELGRLELERGEGLVEAVALLERGPAAPGQHALTVVRRDLLLQLEGRFARWGERVEIAPDDASRSMILASLVA